MAIVKGYRGQGIGTRLLECGIGWATEASAHKITLQVWPHNDSAIALYKRMGFHRGRCLRRHHRRRSGELWDPVVMRLQLDPEP